MLDRVAAVMDGVQSARLRCSSACCSSPVVGSMLRWRARDGVIWGHTVCHDGLSAAMMGAPALSHVMVEALRQQMLRETRHKLKKEPARTKCSHGRRRIQHGGS